jgi:ArsR family transcriptional regulator
MTEAVALTQPTVSHHLKVLVDAGILRRERRGTWAWFALVPGRLEERSPASSTDRLSSDR